MAAKIFFVWKKIGKSFENFIRDGLKRYDHEIHAYCWMKNHIHLAIRVNKISLSKIIQNLAFRYTRWWNKREKRIGHLFQGRYKSILVDDDSYLLELVRYIHLNPVRAKITLDPFDYPWSGHRSYLGHADKEWLSTEWVLSQFSDNKLAAKKCYEKFIAEGIGKEVIVGITLRNTNRVIGSEKFVEEVFASSKEIEEKPKVSFTKIKTVVLKHYGISMQDLMSMSENRKLSKIRKMIGYLSFVRNDILLTEVAKELKRDASTLSYHISGLKEKLKSDNKLKKEIKQLERLLE